MLSYYSTSATSKFPVNVLLVFLHGLGDVGRSWSDFFPPQHLSKALDACPSSSTTTHNVCTIFPNAPKRPITLNGGFVMPGWYDLTTLTEPTLPNPISKLTLDEASQLSSKVQEDKKGLEQSASDINELLLDLCQQYSVKMDQIILGGNSTCMLYIFKLYFMVYYM